MYKVWPLGYDAHKHTHTQNVELILKVLINPSQSSSDMQEYWSVKYSSIRLGIVWNPNTKYMGIVHSLKALLVIYFININ